MSSLPDSLPINIKVSFFEYQRKEWEKVLEACNHSEANPAICMQHWASINTYALAKIQEIDKQLEALKVAACPKIENMQK
ncbi:MAG: hypothetical protein ACM3UY_00640 [Methanocella sp.]|jgi:hypothetical protein